MMSKIAAVAAIAIVGTAGVSLAENASAATNGPQMKVKRTPHFLVVSTKTKSGWKTNKHRVRYKTYKYSYHRHCFISKKGGTKHIKCGKWHKKLRHHRVKRVKRQTGGSSAWVLPARVVMCESGGNPRVVNRTGAGAANGFPAGLYQITGPTWRAYGGTRFAPTADRASVWAQGVIAKRVLANQGTRAWACW